MHVVDNVQWPHSVKQPCSHVMPCNAQELSPACRDPYRGAPRAAQDTLACDARVQLPQCAGVFIGFFSAGQLV